MDTEIEAPGGLNLAERLRRLANGRSTLDVAQFQFIGLAEIRGRYGERWPAKRERVNQIARHFIQKRIAPDDVMVAGADGFLVVFGGYSGPLADAAANRIARELNTFFLGDPDLDDVQLEATHQSMTIDDFADAFGQMLTEAHEAMPRPASAGGVQMWYTPVWDAMRGALTTHFISPVDPVSGMPLDWDHSSHRHAEMDALKLKASEDAMRRLFATGRMALVGVAVHATSLNSQQSMARLVATMASFDRQLARFRVLRVSGVEPGFPRIYLEDMLRTLRGRVPNVAIGLNWMESDVASVVKMKPAAIGFSLPPGTLGQPGSRAELLARVHAAAELGRQHGVPVGVDGDITPEWAQRLAQEGARHIASPRIWPVRAELTAAEIWPASRLGPGETSAA